MNIREIDLRYVDKDGVYINMDIPIICHLSDTEILTLRQYYNDKNIASNRKIHLKSGAPIKIQKRKLKLTKKKIVEEKIKVKVFPNILTKYSVIIGGMVISLVMLGQILTMETSGSQTRLIQKDIDELPKLNSTSLSIMTTQTQKEENEEIEAKSEDADEIKRLEKLEQEAIRKQTIRDYCNIYQVNYDIVYPNLVRLTNNFSNADYLNGYIKGVTCKSEEVHASSEEELLLYTVRCMKHLPERLGLSKDLLNEDNLYKKNGYVSPDDYLSQLDFVSKIIGVDRRLLFAIVQTECGFDSEQFNEINNPAGLKDSDTGNYWIFDTKEEGFLELGMELKKYYRLIGSDPTRIDYDTIKNINDIHAPGNDYWRELVFQILEYAQLHEEELFGSNMTSDVVIKF